MNQRQMLYKVLLFGDQFQEETTDWKDKLPIQAKPLEQNQPHFSTAGEGREVMQPFVVIK